MREFNEFQAIWRAPAFNRALYQDVGLRWRGIGMRYLMLVLALTWLVLLAKATVDFTRYINGDATSDLADFPPMTLTRGHVSSPVTQPFVYRHNGRPVFVLDTTGEVTRPGERGAEILITETTIVQEQPGMTRRTPLAGMPDMVVDKEHLLGWMRGLRNWLIPLGLPVCWAFSIAYRLVCALLIAAIGLGFAAGFGARISYAGLLRLTMVAMTPVLLLDTILSLAGIGGGCWPWFVYPLITLGYLAFGVKAVASVTRDAPPAFPVEAAMMPDVPASPAPPPPPGPTPPETDQLFP